MHILWHFHCLTLFSASLCAATEFLPTAKNTKIQSADIREASGMAISPTNPGFMWIINDSGNPPEIHLAGTDGSDHGKVSLKGAKNNDWEDLASFILDGKPYLIVADTGDNNAKRESPKFYVFREPEIPSGAKLLAETVSPAWVIQFRYQDGPRDCESVAVDAQAEKIYFLSKRTVPPELYELPLRASEKNGVQVVKAMGAVSVKSPNSDLIPFLDQPTGLDISADGTLAAVITYYGIFIYHKSPKQSWAAAFSQKPVVLPEHRLGQAESVAFSKDGKSIYALAEGESPEVIRYDSK